MRREESNLMEGFLFSESGFTAQLCRTEASKKIAYQLRYRAYRSVDGIPQNDLETAIDDYDAQPNARTHLLWYEGKPVASVRSLIWSDRYDWQSTTSLDTYRPAIDAKLGLNKRLLESNRYVVDPDFKGRKSLTAQYLLFRIQAVSCLFDHCEYVITAVREKHIAIYQRLMDFYPISDPMPVRGFQFKAVLLATPYASRHVLAKNASIAALQLEDFEQYISHLSTPLFAK